MIVNGHALGTLIETDRFLVLLGNRESNIQQLQDSFPQISFKRVKQVHKDRAVHTSLHSLDFSQEADAHYTNERNLGLAISTADCIPLLIYHHEPRWIASIHAGWRGVENRIVPKTIAALKRNGCRSEGLCFFIGPHIQKESFEVGNDVRDQLLSSCRGDKNSLWQSLSAEKSKVDLNEILKLQLLESGIDFENVFFEVKNTATDQNYHSYRRDKENSGRQLSFISLK